MTSSQIPERAHRYVLILGTLAAAALAVNVALLLASPSPASWTTLAVASLFLLAFVWFERLAVSFIWRGHRITIALTEVAIYLGFIALAPTLVALLTPLVRAVLHLASRRPPVKGVFNMAQVALAASAGAATLSVATATGTPLLLAAVFATVAYNLASEAQLAGLFALIERVSPFRVWRERLLLANVVSLAAGVPAALALIGLYRLHPAATLAAVPVLFMLVRSTRLQSQVDREIVARRRLADDGRHLIGTQSDEDIVRRIFRTCQELLDVSRVRLARGESVWEDQYETSPAGRASTQVDVVGRDGEHIGTLEVWPRALKPAYTQDDRALLQIIAGQAAHGFESARALAEVAAQRDLIARQEKLSALGTLIAGVAHEINNPLTYMRLRTRILRGEAERALHSDDEATRAFAKKTLDNVDVLERGIERLGGLSHSLKVVAKPGDGQRRETDVNDVVQQVMTIMTAAEKQVKYEVELAEAPLLVHANAGELHQVILNLVKNAVEALEGHAEPVIRVRVRPAEHGATLVVQDNGPGIPADAQAQLFTPFFTTKDKGTGLGLSISHQIVTAHGGELRFVTRPDQGTTFIVTLPSRAPVVVPVEAA